MGDALRLPDFNSSIAEDAVSVTLAVTDFCALAFSFILAHLVLG